MSRTLPHQFQSILFKIAAVRQAIETERSKRAPRALYLVRLHRVALLLRQRLEHMAAQGRARRSLHAAKQLRAIPSAVRA